jgi:hypothetical protein
MSSLSDDALRAGVRELLDRQAILDCLYRYTRGADRLDIELLRSAFWEDAVDHHGPVNGGVDDFLAYWLPLQEAREISQHYLHNHSVELDGDVAHAETYFSFVVKLKGESEVKVSGGRYADRFERRGGEWRIATRVVMSEWGLVADGTPTIERLANARGRQDHGDPTYLRPLLGLPLAAG